MIRQEAARIPAFDVGRIRKWQKKISQHLLAQGYCNTIIDDTRLTGLVQSLRAVLKLDVDNSAQELALRQSLLEFIGHEVTLRVIDQLSVKLAGGRSLLLEGKSVTGTLAEADWYPVMITDMRFDRIVNNKTRIKMSVIVTAGNMAGRELAKSVSYKLVMWMIANELAWSRKDMRPLHTELVGMWCYIYIDWMQDKVDLDEIKALPQHKRYNKKLRAMRASPCLRHYNQRCHTCPVGYSECMLGTHRYTWIIKHCHKCKRENAAFDPEQRYNSSCISCQTREVRAHWARERLS